MSGIDWAGTDMVLACQLVSATTLAVHLLILRPRAAKQDLFLDARIVQDELDLAERLGHVAPGNVETVAVQQLLRRIRQNPRSAALVLERIPELAQAARLGSRPMEVEYLGGVLDRLSDAAQRYLRGAWPRAGALSSTFPAIPSSAWEFDGTAPDLDPDPYNLTDVLYLTDEDMEDSEDKQDSDDTQDSHDSEDDGPEDGARPEPVADSGPDLDSLDVGSLDLGSLDAGSLDPGAEPDGPEPAWTATEAQIDLSDDDETPSWVELVTAEAPRRMSGPGDGEKADRHARPYRPARSTDRSSSRRADSLDRSSVLPR